MGAVASAIPEWKNKVMPILEHFVDRTPGSFVEEKKWGLVWHYRMAEPEFGEWLANELVSMLEAMLAETEVRAFRGEKIIEVKPVWANKGEVLERLQSVVQIRTSFLPLAMTARMKICSNGCRPCLDPPRRPGPRVLPMSSWISRVYSGY